MCHASKLIFEPGTKKHSAVFCKLKDFRTTKTLITDLI